MPGLEKCYFCDTRIDEDVFDEEENCDKAPTLFLPSKEVWRFYREIFSLVISVLLFTTFIILMFGNKVEAQLFFGKIIFGGLRTVLFLITIFLIVYLCFCIRYYKSHDDIFTINLIKMMRNKFFTKDE